MFIAAAAASLTALVLLFTARFLASRGQAPAHTDATPAPKNDRPGKEKRRFARLKAKGIAVLVGFRRCGAQSSNGWMTQGCVANRSRGGVALTLPWAVGVDTVLRVRSASAPQGAEWAVVRVRHCAPLEKKLWVVGCEFVGTPPWGSI